MVVLPSSVFAGFGILYGISGVDINPVTGRMRLMYLSHEDERQLGDAGAKSILEEESSRVLPAEHEVTQYVQEVADLVVGHLADTVSADSGVSATLGVNLAAEDASGWTGIDGRVLASAAAKGKGLEWDVHVIKSPVQNAFVLPGGHIFVYTGILDVCKTRDQLAFVIGHEAAHALSHHR